MRRKCLFGWALLTGMLSCSPVVDSGQADLETQGQGPNDIPSNRRETSGRLELARVRFAGNHMTTALIGNEKPERADGHVLVVGRAQFNVPASDDLTSLQWIMPAEEQVSNEMRCRFEFTAAPAAGNVPGLPVDAGAWIQFESSSSALKLTLERQPSIPAHNPDGPFSWHYEHPYRAADAIESGNWRPEDELVMKTAGASPPPDERRTAMIFGATVPERILLPSVLEAVSVQGTALEGPWIDQASGEIIREADTILLPASNTPLELAWQSENGDPLLFVLEAFGPGEGRCPAGCGEEGESNCCSSSDACLSTEICASNRHGDKKCVPELGDALDRKAALICRLPDTGQASIDGETIARFRTALEDDEVRSVVLRLGRTRFTEVTLPDAMGAGNTKAPVTPIVVQTSDVVLTRLEF